MELTISATAVKEWFQYRCERKFVYRCMSSDAKKHIPIQEKRDPSRWGAIGNKFEREIIDHYAKTDGVKLLTPNPGDKQLSETQTVPFLKGTHAHTAATQLVLTETLSTRQLLTDLPEEVSLWNGHVDLAIVSTTADATQRLVHLVDVKATQHATRFHMIQVAWYALMTEALITDNQLGQTVKVDAHAEIWHGPVTNGLPTKTRFALAPYRGAILDWIKRELQNATHRLVDPQGDNTRFHIYFKCEPCEYLDHCTKAIEPPLPIEKWDVSAVPGLYPSSKETLRRHNIKTVEQLHRQQADLDGSEDLSARLRSKHKELTHRAKALLEQQVERVPGNITLRMAPKTDVAILLLADHNPIDAQLATLGVTVVDRRTDTPDHTVVRLIRNRTDETAALRDVTTVIANTLKDVDGQNRTHPSDNIILHLFVYEPAESWDLATALGRQLNDPGLTEALFHLIRIFPPEGTLPEPEYRGYHHLPASALRTVMEDLYALPVKVSYDLARVSDALTRHATPPTAPYRPDDAFRQHFSSRLSLDHCVHLVDATLEPDLPAIERDVRARLAAMAGLVRWLETEHTTEKCLRLKKRPFQLYDTVHPVQTIRQHSVDFLTAQTLLDARVQEFATLQELGDSRARRIERGNCVGLKLVKHDATATGHWFLFNPISPQQLHNSRIRPGDYNLILSDGDHDRVLDRTQWASLGVTYPQNQKTPTQLYIRMTTDNFESESFQDVFARCTRDGGFYLDTIYKDRNSERQQSFLDYVAGGTA